MNDILIVGGSFDGNSGKPSKIVSGLAESFDNPRVVNGGHIDLVRNLSLDGVKCLVWMPNIDNSEPKILLDIKKRSPHLLLVSSKRVVEKEYSHFDIISRLLKTRSNLGIMVTKANDLYNFELLDPLGNSFCSTSDIKTFSSSLNKRVEFLLNIKRESFQGDPGFSEETLAQAQSEIKGDYIELVKMYAQEFTEHVNAINPSRFLGNTSTRCMQGFPSQRGSGRGEILVSRRNVDKETLSKKDFVPLGNIPNCYGFGPNRFYIGSNKPSVDSPIQYRLYESLLNINFMIHGHVYVENAETTQEIIPCGGLQEVDEVLSIVTDPITTSFVVNLRGHGFLAGGHTVNDLKGLKFVSRGLPEVHK